MKKIFTNWYFPLPRKYEKEVFWDEYIITRKFVSVQQGFLYWLKYLIKNIIFLYFYKERKEADIQIFDGISWCFYYDKNKKNILLIHSYDIWVWSEIILQSTTSKIKKWWYMILEFLFWRYIRKKIKMFDGVYAATHDRYLYIKKNIRDDVIFLPNIIDIDFDSSNKKISPQIKRVFCPERAEKNKWLDFRKKVILKIIESTPDVQFNFLNYGLDLDNFKKWVHQNNINAIWIDYLEKDELKQKIYDSDLVIWIFNNGSLSLTNLETMLLRTPIITYDKWWSIKKEKNDLLSYLEELINNKWFRETEVEKNYNFVKDFYCVKNFKKLLFHSIN